MAFRQSTLPPLSRRYSNPSQQLADNDIPTQGRQGHYEPQLGPISDFGSLNTIPHSGEEELSDIVEDVIDDLDSLDDGLQAFRDIPTYKTLDVHGGAILPAHDGLGSFHPAKAQDLTLETDRSASPWSFNKPASRLDELNDEHWDEDKLERSRHERVEQWRLEQSKIVLEEIEKQRQKAEAKLAANKTIAQPEHPTPEELGSESIWQQLARHVMRDLIGVDDTILSAIFGEDLMPEEDLSKTPTSNIHYSQAAASSEAKEGSVWNRLIEELRQLAQGLSDTPVTREQLAGQLEYAGIPVSWLEDRLVLPKAPEPSASAQFKPTLPSPSSVPLQSTALPEPSTTEQAYWEQTPDIKSVISYLYRRFRSSSTTIQHTVSTAQKTQEALDRAAIIQQCHPLTSRHQHHFYHTRNKKHFRQPSSSHRAGSFASGVPHLASLKRRGSSCASWSTKRSRRGESNASRNYWDLGESIGSGSLVFAGVGAWGEI